MWRIFREFSCGHFLGRCPSTVLRVALGRALIQKHNETVLGTNPHRTHDQPKPYLEAAETVLDLYSDKGMFPFLLRGARKKNLLKIHAFPFSNRTRNRTRTTADFSWKLQDENLQFFRQSFAAFFASVRENFA